MYYHMSGIKNKNMKENILSDEDFTLWKKYEKYIRNREGDIENEKNFKALAEKLESEGAFDELREDKNNVIYYSYDYYACIQSPLGVHLYVWNPNEEEYCGFCGEWEECK